MAEDVDSPTCTPGNGVTTYRRLPGYEELVDVEVSGGESGFTAGQVEIPGAAKHLVEAEPGRGGPVPIEAGPPQGEGGAVVLAEGIPAQDAQAGAARQGFLDPLDRGDEPAR